MPTTSSKRRRVSGPANTLTKPSPAAQSTLSFGSRITKPSARADAKAKSAEAAKKAAASLPEEAKPALAVADIHIEDVAEEVKPAEETAEEELAEDAAARAVTTAQIGRYWAAKERARKAPRVHQEGLSVGEKVLREFDMESRFGPSIGIKRVARWRRAHGLGLAPPIEVLAVLLQEEGKADVERMQRSIVDELMSSHVAIEA